MFLRIIDLKLLKVRIAIEKLLMIRDAVILDPGVGTNKTIRKPAYVSLPVTDEEVEVVRSVMRRSGRFTSCRRQQCQLQRHKQSNETVFHR
jgi:hypothetical protein